ncbi:MAG: phenylalanine--tRNA ligase subunit beta [Verrucomicrobiaceae bacterium]|nr:phenylalanine--tRNA ligase subunit beta [Verrucomicrobiaceae bacterium]
MKFNELWLREWVQHAPDTAALSTQLTMAGLEVDSLSPVAAKFTGVVVGEIIEIAPHPDADKLRVCLVSDGEQTVQVVCGAANARQGLKIPFAQIGAQLPGDFSIKKAKLRGVESYGMLCAAVELGLSDQSDGLLELPQDAPVGTDIRSFLQLDDNEFDIGLTPNRADCLSIIGLAREVATLNRLEVNAPAYSPIPAAIDATLPVQIDAAAQCPRYVGRIIRNVDVSKPAPQWLTERLRRSGVRSIDAVVDVTNYVMLELGQPMHAFDLEKIDGGIRVRLATAGETLQTLTNQELKLNAETLVIADHHKALAIAGIMGGQHSAVSETTRHIFLESAFFTPSLLAGRARSYGLHTESSHRFERGVDYQLQVRAIERATQLILSIVGGQAGPVAEVESDQLPTPVIINLRRHAISRLLGFDIPDNDVETILQRLGLDVKSVSDGWSAEVPSWRFDLSIEADLIEELARVYGYNRLPVRSISSDLPLPAKPERQLHTTAVRRSLVARGYQEVITYSFVDPKIQALLAPQQAVVELINPISNDLSVMRTTLWAGLLQTAQYNLNRQQPRVRLFETGLSFSPAKEGIPEQQKMLALLATGSRFTESWSAKSEQIDFYDVKGDVEALLKLARIDEVSFAPASHPALHPGQSAAIRVGENTIGWVGALHPHIQAKLDLSMPVYLAEVQWSAIASGELSRFAELSKFPEVRRDVAVLVERDVLAATLLDAARHAAGELLRDLTLFDVYQGKGIDPQRKSLAFGLTFQHTSRTLTEDEINAAVESVVNVLKTRFAAELRN